MTRVLDHNGRDADRTVIVAAIAALKAIDRQFTPVTAGTAEEADAIAPQNSPSKPGGNFGAVGVPVAKARGKRRWLCT